MLCLTCKKEYDIGLCSFYNFEKCEKGKCLFFVSGCPWFYCKECKERIFLNGGRR